MNKHDLDNYITGHYGEDQMDHDFERLVDAAGSLHALIQTWRETGLQPNFGELTEAHDRLGAALKDYD